MDEQARILEMLAEGKITVEEAEGLLDALRSGKDDEPPPNAEELSNIIEWSLAPIEDLASSLTTSLIDSVGEHADPKIEIGGFISEGVDLPPGSNVGTGAFIGVGVTIESAIKIGMGAYVGDGAHLSEGCSVGDGANIGEAAIIGRGVKIHAGAFIGAGLNIPEGAKIGPGANIPEGTQVRAASEVPR